MAYRIDLKLLQEVISKTTFKVDGDDYEITYGNLITPRYPNCEIFWANFVVPFTKRIIVGITNQKEKISPREGIHSHIKDIASFHYTMFLNLIYAYDHLINFRISSFEDFYIHLVCACDLAEECLSKLYLLILICNKQESKILSKMGKEVFLEMAEVWYDINYQKLYEDYLSKGKSIPIKLIDSGDILKEYFKGG